MNKRALITSALMIVTVVGVVLIISQSSDLTALVDLAKVFGYISLLTIGGGMAAFPELKVLTVETHHWLTAHQLIHLYSVGQMAPGPNIVGDYVSLGNVEADSDYAVSQVLRLVTQAELEGGHSTGALGFLLS